MYNTCVFAFNDMYDISYILLFKNTIIMARNNSHDV